MAEIPLYINLLSSQFFNKNNHIYIYIYIFIQARKIVNMKKQYRTKLALYVDNFLYVVGGSTTIFTKQKIKYQYKTSYIKIK